MHLLVEHPNQTLPLLRPSSSSAAAPRSAGFHPCAEGNVAQAIKHLEEISLSSLLFSVPHQARGRETSEVADRFTPNREFKLCSNTCRWHIREHERMYTSLPLSRTGSSQKSLPQLPILKVLPDLELALSTFCCNRSCKALSELTRSPISLLRGGEVLPKAPLLCVRSC